MPKKRKKKSSRPTGRYIYRKNGKFAKKGTRGAKRYYVPAAKKQRRDKYGRYVTKGQKLTPPRRNEQGQYAPGPVPPAAVSLSKIVRDRFTGSDRTFENTWAHSYTKAGTYHKRYKTSLDPAAIGGFVSTRFKKPKKAALILTYVDQEGELQHRSTHSTSSEDTEKLLGMFDEMLNKYETSAEIVAIEDVDLAIWGFHQDWEGEQL